MDTTLLILVLQAASVLVATTLHEFVRAVTSTLLGDKKPRQDGRLTLNPVRHFEPIGFILAFLTGCGWGKPVETSALYYKNRKQNRGKRYQKDKDNGAQDDTEDNFYS